MLVAYADACAFLSVGRDDYLKKTSETIETKIR